MDENKWNWSTEGLKNTCSLWTRKTPFAPTQWNCFQLHLWHSDLEANKCLRMVGMAGSIITQRALSHLKSVEQVDVDLSRIWTKALWLLPTKRQRGYPNTYVHNADHLLVKSDTKSPFGARRKSNCPLHGFRKSRAWEPILGEGWCWSTMSSTSLPSMRKAGNVTALWEKILVDLL